MNGPPWHARPAIVKAATPGNRPVRARLPDVIHLPTVLHALVATVNDQPGMLSRLTKVFADHQVDIRYVDLHTRNRLSEIYFELTLGDIDMPRLLDELRALPGVHRVDETVSFGKIY